MIGDLERSRQVRWSVWLLALAYAAWLLGWSVRREHFFFADDWDWLYRAALMTLNKRERHILSERRLTENPATLEDLSHRYGISRERVRQIEVRAFEKLQKTMKATVAAEERARETRRLPGRESTVGA